MTETIQVLLLLALPASGKSEIRRYLQHLEPNVLLRDMHIGRTVQLDDYPYVHLMRRISQEQRAAGVEPAFFESDTGTWREPLDWLTLIELVNDDHAAAIAGGRATQPAGDLLDRLEMARNRVGAPRPFSDATERSRIEAAIAPDVAALDPIDAVAAGDTIVIEFARGGPVGADMPLPHPLGYRASIGALDDAILEHGRVLYVWVDPEESRRKNRERAVPTAAGDASILHHGVPEAVMLGEYGVDDMAWLEGSGRRPGTIPIGAHDLPIARFDNRTDKTSFLRAEPDAWPPHAVELLHRELGAAFSALA
jgi:hypothetical protein